jgi:hypothetical protein
VAVAVLVAVDIAVERDSHPRIRRRSLPAGEGWGEGRVAL